MNLVKDCDPNGLSYFEIHGMCVQLRAPTTTKFHYLIPRGNLEQGFRFVIGDEEVVYMNELHVGWLTDRIIFYVENDEMLLVVAMPCENVEGDVEENREDHETTSENDLNFLFIKNALLSRLF